MRKLLGGLGGAVLLAGCATQGASPVQVTRFNLGQPIAPGTVAVEPLDPRAANTLEQQTYQRAVQAELTRLGFTPAPNLAQSELVASVGVDRGTRQALAARSPVSVGLGGGSFGGGVGLGGGVNFPIGKARSRDVTVTELMVRVKRRSDGTAVWEGRAQGEARADTPAADPDAAVARLASALFRDFPGRSGETVTVK